MSFYILKDTVPDPPPPPEPGVAAVNLILEDLIVNPIKIHADNDDLGTIDLTNLENDETPDPTPSTVADQDFPRPLRAWHVPTPRTHWITIKINL